MILLGCALGNRKHSKSLDLCLLFAQNNGIMDTAEWARQKVDSQRAARVAEDLRAALSLERSAIRKANFPDLAQAVVTSFQKLCEEYNKVRAAADRSVGFHSLSPSMYMLRRDAGFSELQVHVNFSAHAIRVTAQNCSFHYDCTYHPEAMDDGRAMLSDSTSRFLRTPDDVARMAIDEFLDGKELAERM